MSAISSTCFFSAISGGATIAESPVVLRLRPFANSFFWKTVPRVPGAAFALQRLKRPAQDVRDLVDVLLLGDERRRDDRRVAGGLEIEAVREQFLLE